MRSFLIFAATKGYYIFSSGILLLFYYCYRIVIEMCSQVELIRMKSSIASDNEGFGGWDRFFGCEKCHFVFRIHFSGFKDIQLRQYLILRMRLR